MRLSGQGSLSPRLVPMLASAFLLGTLLLLVLGGPYLNHDVAQYVTAGQMLLQGARPYVEIVDTNPPMVVYLSAVPALLARLTGAPLAHCGMLFFVVLVLGLLLLQGHALKAAGLSPPEIHLAYIAQLLYHLWVWFGEDFGQRDHLLFPLIAPYVLIRYSRGQQRPVPAWLAVAGGTAAFLAAAMKPIYLAGILLVEVFAAPRWRLRALRSPEVYALGGLGLAYLLHPLVVPGMVAGMQRWLPLIARGYAIYGAGPMFAASALLRDPIHLVALLVSLSLVVLFVLHDRPFTRLVMLLGLFAVGGAFLYVIQAKGWTYHGLPVVQAGATASAIIVGRLRGWRSAVPTVVSILLLALLPLFYPGVLSLWTEAASRPLLQFEPNDVANAIVAHTEPDDRVLIISTSVYMGFPGLTLSGRTHAGRFLCTYPLAFFFHDSAGTEPPPLWRDEERAFYRTLVEDVERHRPAMIMVFTGYRAQAAAEGFRISEYLRSRGFYGKVLGSYRLAGKVSEFDCFVLESGRGTSSRGGVPGPAGVP